VEPEHIAKAKEHADTAVDASQTADEEFSRLSIELAAAKQNQAVLRQNKRNALATYHTLLIHFNDKHYQDRANIAKQAKLAEQQALADQAK
jgi:hypothetical protein